jgi:hypothetical protein
MKFTLFTTALAAIASVGFAESSSIRVNDAGGAATTTLGAAAATRTTEGASAASVVGEVTSTTDKKNQRHHPRGLGKKADGKDPDGYMCKHCCNDDWYCGGD